MDLLDIIPADVPSQDRVHFSNQMKRHLKDAMDALSEQERTAFVLRHFEGLSIEEIGAVLKIGTSATKNSIFRAVRKLRGTLEPLMA
jgi:RNA polymerase sigma-70 factor (ECF subfamily)